MPELPKSLEAAVAQARDATQAALADGHSRLQIELLFPELKPMPLALQFVSVFEELGAQLKVFFPDAGAAALARRDWGDVPFKIVDIGMGRISVERQIQPEDGAFVFVAPSAVEVAQVEQLSQAAGERPFVLFNPRLEDVATVGLGYAGREIRRRFLSTIESCYHLRPLDQAALFRCYPSGWQVWVETQENDYQLMTELPNKPSGEELEQILAGPNLETGTQSTRKAGFFTNLGRFMRTLSR